MRTRGRAMILWAGPFLVLSAAVAGAQTTEAHAHLAHVTRGFEQAPGGRGLAVATAEEISLAMRHANLAAVGDPAGLDVMQRHAGHVLRLLDPTEAAEGPGLGLGVVRGAQAIATHMELAAAAADASASLRTHASHVVQAARAVAARGEALTDLARRVRSATTAQEALPLAEALREMALQLDTGEDVDGSGALDLNGVESGFGQLEDHLYLVLEGEGLHRVLR